MRKDEFCVIGRNKPWLVAPSWWLQHLPQINMCCKIARGKWLYCQCRQPNCIYSPFRRKRSFCIHNWLSKSNFICFPATKSYKERKWLFPRYPQDTICDGMFFLSPSILIKSTRGWEWGCQQSNWLAFDWQKSQYWKFADWKLSSLLILTH